MSDPHDDDALSAAYMRGYEDGRREVAAIPPGVHQELWSGLNELDEAYGANPRTFAAREWLRAQRRERKPGPEGSPVEAE